MASVLIFPLSVGGGLVLGGIGGGRLHRLSDLRFRATALLLLALVGQIGLRWAAAAYRFPLLVATYALAGAWVVVNVKGRSTALRWAVGLLAMGWMLNAAPIAANGGMPVSRHAIEQVSGPQTGDIDAGNIDKHVAAAGGSRLRLLGDVIPVRPLKAVVSLGDLAMVGGIMLALVAGMRTACSQPCCADPRRISSDPGASRPFEPCLSGSGD